MMYQEHIDGLAGCKDVSGAGERTSRVKGCIRSRRTD